MSPQQKQRLVQQRHHHGSNWSAKARESLTATRAVSGGGDSAADGWRMSEGGRGGVSRNVTVAARPETVQTVQPRTVYRPATAMAR
jgi:hypothetical protein